MNKENKKVKTIFYINQNDRNSIKLESEKLQIKSSQYVRIAVREKLGKPLLNIKKQDLDTKKYTTELIRIGVNLNQIAKKLNSGGAKFMIEDQQIVLNEIQNITNHILEIKSKL